nr:MULTISPECIES: hypothetical protein [unclassified Pseudomonas]
MGPEYERGFRYGISLTGILTGAHTTRRRHLRQANAIQEAISDRWHRNKPWTWQQKHLAWFLSCHVGRHANSTNYYYRLTVNLIILRLGKPWQVNHQSKG